MKIGIIVYSATGNTYSVADKLYKKLLDEKYSVSLEKIEIEKETKEINKNFKIIKKPDIQKYDILIFASPVEAFNLCPVMINYLNDIQSLNNKKTMCFVTEFFPFPWMGGNQAIKRMRDICQKKGAIVYNTGVINWTNKKREQRIEDLVKMMVNSIKDIK